MFKTLSGFGSHSHQRQGWPQSSLWEKMSWCQTLWRTCFGWSQRFEPSRTKPVSVFGAQSAWRPPLATAPSCPSLRDSPTPMGSMTTGRLRAWPTWTQCCRWWTCRTRCHTSQEPPSSPPPPLVPCHTLQTVGSPEQVLKSSFSTLWSTYIIAKSKTTWPDS